MKLYNREPSTYSEVQNADLQRQYLALKDQPETQKTHFFKGRFENVYLGPDSITGLSELLLQALGFAASILAMDQSQLKIGFWFNEMHQGHSTTAHTHDEDDELLSAVYYVTVPESSGDLVLGDATNSEAIHLTPEAGEFIFFAPNLLHSVETNQSDQMRLSIGLNIGPKA